MRFPFTFSLALERFKCRFFTLSGLFLIAAAISALVAEMH